MVGLPPTSGVMISGPDLGAGYLHQLTFEETAGEATFTFHAQDGGSDAGGPPKGPLGPLGFVHPPAACPFGGPRCWHRRFHLPRDATPRVRLAYNRSRFALDAMLGQSALGAPADIEGALSELVERLGDGSGSGAIPWYVGGSTAAWILGAPLAPHDLDLGTSRDGVDRIAERLAPYLIEPAAPTEWPGVGAVIGAKAFVGTFEKGARVEWSVPLDPNAPPPYAEFGGIPDAVRTLPARFRDRSLTVTRPEYGLVRAGERGDASAIPVYVALVRSLGVDTELLRSLLGRSRLAGVQRGALEVAVGVPGPPP